MGARNWICNDCGARIVDAYSAYPNHCRGCGRRRQVAAARRCRKRNPKRYRPQKEKFGKEYADAVLGRMEYEDRTGNYDRRFDGPCNAVDPTIEISLEDE